MIGVSLEQRLDSPEPRVGRSQSNAVNSASVKSRLDVSSAITGLLVEKYQFSASLRCASLRRDLAVDLAESLSKRPRRGCSVRDRKRRARRRFFNAVANFESHCSGSSRTIRLRRKREIESTRLAVPLLERAREYGDVRKVR